PSGVAAAVTTAVEDPPPAVMSGFIPPRPEGTSCDQGIVRTKAFRRAMSRAPCVSRWVFQPELNGHTYPFPLMVPPIVLSQPHHWNRRTGWVALGFTLVPSAASSSYGSSSR